MKKSKFELKSYDIVSDPGFEDSTIKSIREELDPYGEENWNDSDNVNQLLPISMRVAARTMGLDLVTVIPMRSPRIDLGFIDFRYNYNTEEKKRI